MFDDTRTGYATHMQLYLAIATVLSDACTDVNEVIARVIAQAFANRITYCSARSQMYVYDPGRNFWTLSVMELESVESAARDIAKYIDAGDFQSALNADSSISPSLRYSIGTRAKWLREQMLRDAHVFPLIVQRLRELVSH